ncbi:CoA pyrophosphatase [Hyphomicrobium sp. CS1GBMeth3]|uniref:CoA pyrophosphatase n=1 Tax=Hyphomicrobium sp. CS1GBMeth3 TaxID=1892845 RepID=UPI000930D894|nr:CoA pyrophosphatase [Hyphomicrobium sp. CS1GBMeth3]
MIPLRLSDPHAFTPAGFRERALSALSGPQPDDGDGPSDFDLNPEVAAARPHPDALATARPAAVLIPAIARETITLLFTQRTNHLAAHAGQIAFPGGKAEPYDADPLATALREAHEEIGLEPSRVTPLGTLDRYLTGTGFRITPVIGLVDPAFTPVPDVNEVADTFEVPLSFLMDARNFQRHSRNMGGVDRHFYAIPFGDRFIWGATAGILRNMHQRLFAP